MTLNEIKKYRLYCAELEEIENKLKSSKNEESTVSILYRKSELIDSISNIRKFVDRIPEYKVRRALQILCIEPLDDNIPAPSWEEVAARIASGVTGNSIRMAVSRYIKLNKKNF